MQRSEAAASALVLLDPPGRTRRSRPGPRAAGPRPYSESRCDYREELPASLTDEDVTLDTLLIGSGDLVYPFDSGEHEAEIAG
jgi:hypothetical protein